MGDLGRCCGGRNEDVILASLASQVTVGKRRLAELRGAFASEVLAVSSVQGS